MTKSQKKFFDTLQLLRGLGMRESELDEITFAYDIARYAHLNQKRDGGQEYIDHPVEGCFMMANEFKVRSVPLYVAFLLHDAGEDTKIFGDRETLPHWKFIRICTERVTRLFGPRVAELVVNLTKPGKIDGGYDTKDQMMEIYLKRLRSDYEAILLKMVDRLHNLRSLVPGNLEKIARQIEETRHKLVPVFDAGIKKATAAHDTNNAIAMNTLLGAIQVQLLKLTQQKKGKK